MIATISAAAVAFFAAFPILFLNIQGKSAIAIEEKNIKSGEKVKSHGRCSPAIVFNDIALQLSHTTAEERKPMARQCLVNTFDPYV